MAAGSPPDQVRSFLASNIRWHPAAVAGAGRMQAGAAAETTSARSYVGPGAAAGSAEGTQVRTASRTPPDRTCMSPPRAWAVLPAGRGDRAASGRRVLESETSKCPGCCRAGACGPRNIGAPARVPVVIGREQTMTLAVCVAGVTGWTGRAVAEAVLEADDLRLVSGVSRSAAGTDLGAPGVATRTASRCGARRRGARRRGRADRLHVARRGPRPRARGDRARGAGGGRRVGSRCGRLRRDRRVPRATTASG